MLDQVLVSDSDEDSIDQLSPDSITSESPSSATLLDSILLETTVVSGVSRETTEPRDEDSPEPVSAVSSTSSRGSKDFIVISHHPKPPSVVIQYGTPRETCSCMDPTTPESTTTTSSSYMAEVCMRGNYGKLQPAQFNQQSFHRLQGSLGAVGPAMNGQVYFGDPYQYKQYLELRHAVSPFPGLAPRLIAPQAPSYDLYSAARPDRLTLPGNPGNPGNLGNRLTLPSSLHPGMGANTCVPHLNGYKATPLPGCSIVPGCGPITNCFTSCGQVVAGSPVYTTGPVSAPVTMATPLTMATPAPLTMATPAPVTTCSDHDELNRVGQVLSPTLLNSALNLTPPTSNPTSVLKQEAEPELLLPEIPDFTDDIFSTGVMTTMMDPETPPCNLDNAMELDISSEFELFLGSKLNDHSLDDLLDQTLEESLDSEIKTKVESLEDEKPILPTPDTTPVKEVQYNQDSSALASISSSQDIPLSIPTIQNVPTPLQISNLQESLSRNPVSIIQDNSSRFPMQTIQPASLSHQTIQPASLSHQSIQPASLSHQTTQPASLSHMPIQNPQTAPTRLSHFDFSTDATSSLMDMKARFEQATYLRGTPSTSGGLKLTEPTPCLDTKEISGRGILRSGKRTRKVNKQTSSNKKQTKGLPDLGSDNHLLEKVMLDTFLNNEHKAADQFFDETMFLGGVNSGVGGGGPVLIPKQSCVRNMGRDYQHLVNCNRKDWGSSDVSVRILPSGFAGDKPFSDPGPALADSSLPSSGLTDQVDFEKEFLF